MIFGKHNGGVLPAALYCSRIHSMAEPLGQLFVGEVVEGAVTRPQWGCRAHGYADATCPIK
jgi:hypothetical protein